MTDREKWLRNVEFRGCDAVPCTVYVSAAVWRAYRDYLPEIVERHPDIDVSPPRPPDEEDCFTLRERRSELWTDAWGCLWENLQDGMVGQVTRPALADWESLSGYDPPSPARTDHFELKDWDRERRLMSSAREAGALARGAVDHGFFFQRLCYLRGFENLMMDMAAGDPRLGSLCKMVLEFSKGLVRRYLDIGVDVVHFGDDLGMQERLMISPQAWRRYVKPAYAELFGMCREAGAHVSLHSDGYIVDIMPDLIECGATILNPQDLCNGIENIRRELKGKVCIELDIDRQSIVPRGTSDQIDAHVGRCVEVLGSVRGGLMLIWGVYPGTPLENIEAVMLAMSRHRHLLADGSIE